MFFYLLASTILGMFFSFVGYGVTASLFKPSLVLKSLIPSSILTGFTIVLFISWLKGTLTFISFPVYALLLLTPIAFSSYMLFRHRGGWKVSRLSLGRFSTTCYATLTGLVMALPMSGGFFTTEVRFRTGPDLLGWGISSRYLQLHNNVEFLKESVRSQLSIESLDRSFQTTDPSTSIYKLSSYQEQVAAEFLLASKRIGLQSFVGSVAQIFQNITAVFIIWSIVCLFFTLASYILISYLSRSTLPVWVKAFALLATLLSPTLIVPVLEGGVWHVIAFTLILWGITLILEDKNDPNLRVLLLPPILIFSLTLTLNSDLLVVCIPFLVLWITHSRVEMLRNSWVILLSLSVLHAPMIQYFLQSVQSRSNDAFVGGWPAARLPFPSDIVGLTPWQEARGFLKVEEAFSLSSILLRIFISVLTISAFYRLSKENKKFIAIYFVPIIAFYAYFLFDFFINDKVLTYIPWKLSFVVISIMPFFIEMVYKNYVSDLTLNSIRKKVSKTHFALQQMSKRKDRSSFIILIASLLVTLQFVRVQIDWANFSTTNSLVSKGTSISFNQNDLDVAEIGKVDIVGSCIPWFQSVALITDLRLIAQRAQGVMPSSSIPERYSAFLINPKLESCQPYLEDLETDKVIYKSPEIALLRR